MLHIPETQQWRIPTRKAIQFDHRKRIGCLHSLHKFAPELLYGPEILQPHLFLFLELEQLTLAPHHGGMLLGVGCVHNPGEDGEEVRDDDLVASDEFAA